MPFIKKQPYYWMLHVETNDSTAHTFKKMLMLKSNISKQIPNCRIVFLKPIIQHDNEKANDT